MIIPKLSHASIRSTRLGSLCRSTCAVLALLALLISSSALVSCSGDSGSSSSKNRSATLDQVLTLAPQGTIGFFTLDLTSSSYKDYLASHKSGFSSSSDTLAQISKGLGVDTVDPDTLAQLVETGTKGGLIPGDTGGASKITKLAGFISGENIQAQLMAGKPDALNGVVLIQGLAGAGFNSKFKAIESKLFELAKGEFGLVGAFSKEQDGVSIYTFTPAIQSSPEPSAPITVALADTAWAIGKPESEVVRIVKGTPGAGVAELTSTEQFKKTTADIAAPGGFMFSYISLLSPKVDQGQNSTAIAPLKPLPISAIAGQVGYASATTNHTFALQLSDSSPAAKSAVSELNSGVSKPRPAVLQSAQGALLFLRVTTPLLNSITAATMGGAQGQDPLLASLAKSQEMALAIYPPASANPFPELALLLLSDSPDELAKEIKQSVQDALANSGMPTAPMQDREVNGHKITFTMSPLGLGLFITAVRAGGVVVATTEQGAVKAADLISSGKSASDDALSEISKELLSQPSFFNLSIDFVRAAQTINQVQGGLVMFTGGQPLVSPGQINEISAMGSVAVNGNMKGDVVTLRSLSRAK